jgi:hypothetical protein
MRCVLAVLFLYAIVQPSFAQTILESEPLYLAPYEVAYVNHVFCEAGKVLRVTGAMRNLPRKKVCIAMVLDQASLSRATR